MDDQEFVKIVQETINTLPKQFLSQIQNVAIVIEKRPLHKAPVLGMYQGTPNTERFTSFSLPSKITIYKMPLLRISRNLDEARGKIRETVLHELGHYFGLSDHDLYKIKMNVNSEALETPEDLGQVPPAILPLKKF